MSLEVLYLHSTSTAHGPPTVDIVAVHGLRGDAKRTWTDSKSKKIWLQDFLPIDIDRPRVMSFDYNAAAAFGNTTAVILDHARSLLGSLIACRESEAEAARPIVFIAHSLGGIIVKQALVTAHDEAEYNSIKDSTRGIFFFATPHKGSEFANYGKVLATVVTIVSNRPRPNLLAALENNNEELSTLTEKFTTLPRNFQISTFYELKPMGIFRNLIVGKESAILGVEGEAPQPVNATHVGICRLGSREDGTYKQFISRFNGMLPKGVLYQANNKAPNPFQSEDSYNKYYDVPHNVSSFFTGRDVISSMLHSKCLPTQPATMQKEQNRFVLHGLGGVGKTQVCLNFAQSHQESFWGIFFADVSSMSKAEQSFSTLARRYQAGDDAVAFKRWLASKTEHWLLILDNADDPSLVISEWFPAGTRGNIIITTRNPRLGIVATAQSALDQMTSKEATTLLLKAAGDNKESSRAQAEPVVQLLGCIPLAIVHAGAAISHQLYTYEEYCGKFTQRRMDLLSYRNIQATDYKYDVYTTWEISVEAIKKSADGGAEVSREESGNAANALDLLNVFGFWYNNNISEEIMHMIWEFVPEIESDPWWMSSIIRLLREERSLDWDPLPFRKSIDILSTYSLITGTDGQFSLHPLVHSWIRDRLDDKSKVKWRTTALTMLAVAVKNKDYGDVQRQRLLGPHLDTCLNNRDIGEFLIEDDVATKRLDLINRVLVYDSRGVLSDDLLSLAQKAVRYGDKMLDENDPQLWRILDSAASVADSIGSWHTIVDLLEIKVISLLETNTPKLDYSLESLQAMQRFLTAYYYLGRNQDASRVAEKVLEICKESRGDNDKMTAYIEERLGLIYANLGREDDSISMSESAYSKLEAAFGRDHPRCVRSKARLADRYIERDPQKASDLHEQVFRWRRSNMPEDDTDTLRSQVSLAIVYGYLRRPEDAIPLVVDALEKGEKIGIPEYDMRTWRSELEALQAMEADQAAQQVEELQVAEEQRGQANEEEGSRSKIGFRSGLKKMLGRD